MSSWAELLRQAEPRQHVVQLYGEDDQLLARNVSRYLGEGLAQADGCLVIDRKSTRLNSSHIQKSRMPSSA